MKKFYLFVFAILFAAGTFAQDKKVMVVSTNLPADDIIVKNIIDNVSSIDGVAAEHVALGDAKVMTDYSGYSAVLLTENGGSTDMGFYSTAGWPLPCVCLKAYMLYAGKGDHPLFTQVSGVNWYASDKSSDLLPGITDLIVKNTDDILKCYTADQQVAWTTGYNTTEALGLGAGEAHVQAIDLKDAVNDEADIVTNSTPLADDKYLVDNAAVPSNLKTFMWKVEENSITKRLFIWGVHHTFLEYATTDFYDILKNAVRWALKMDCVCPGSAVKEVEARPYQMYPNPVVDQLNFSQASIISSVNIIDITGKIVFTVNNHNDHLLINTSSLAKGLYFVRVNTTDGKVFSDKLAK
jgi:hypothetical protein